MTLKFSALTLIVVLLSLVTSTTVFSNSELYNNRGLEIAIEADRRDNGFGDSSASMQMILRNRHGEVIIVNCVTKPWKSKTMATKSLSFSTPHVMLEELHLCRLPINLNRMTNGFICLR